MKRFLVVLTLLFFSCLLCFADEGTQDSTSLNITAQKSGSLSSSYALVVTATVPTSISQGQTVIGQVGSVESFDITPAFVDQTTRDFTKSTTLTGVLELTVGTNSKKPVLVDVWFSAFRDTTRYKGEGEQMEFDAVAASNLPVTWTAKSNVTESNYTTADQTYGGVQYYYKLVPKANNTTLSGSKSCSVTAKTVTGETMNLVFTPVEKNGSIPETEPATLPGMNPGNNPTLISRTVVFDLALDKNSNYFKIPANTNYTCTVRITVKGD